MIYINTAIYQNTLFISHNALLSFFAKYMADNFKQMIDYLVRKI